MTGSKNEILVLGQFGSAHGVKGHVKLHSFTQNEDSILNYQPWLIKFKNGWQTENFVNAEKRTKFFSVLMENCHNRDHAERYKNCEIGIYKNQLHTLDDSEFYWHELIDMTVINTEGENLGKVTQLVETGANDVLIVEGEKRHLIPFLLGESVVEIKRDQAEITVNWQKDF